MRRDIRVFGNLRRHVTLQPIAERLPMEFLPPVLTTLRSVATWGRTPNSRMRGERSNTKPPTVFILYVYLLQTKTTYNEIT